MEEEPGEDAAVGGQDFVAEVEAPDEGAAVAQRHPGIPEAVIDEDQGRGAADDLSIDGDDVDGLLAFRPQGLGYRRIRRVLIGDGLEDFSGVGAPDPGCEASSEASRTVPEDEVSIHVSLVPSS
jgi:hypothetical protein